MSQIKRKTDKESTENIYKKALKNKKVPAKYGVPRSTNFIW